MLFINSDGREGVRIICRSAERAEIFAGVSAETYSAELLPGELIDINSANADELARLPGIGETLAEAIAAYREKNGDFSSLSELMLVDGIGQDRFDAIADKITLGD